MIMNENEQNIHDYIHTKTRLKYLIIVVKKYENTGYAESCSWIWLHKNVASNIEQVLAATPNKAPTIRTSASHHENYPS